MSSILKIISLYEDESMKDNFFFFRPPPQKQHDVSEKVMSYATLSEISSYEQIRNGVNFNSKHSILGNFIKEEILFQVQIDSKYDGIKKTIPLPVEKLSKTFGRIIYDILDVVNKEEEMFFSLCELGATVSERNLGDDRSNCECQIISYRTYPIFKTKDFITFVNFIFLPRDDECEEKMSEQKQPFIVDVLIHSFRGPFKCSKCGTVFKKWEKCE